MNTMTIRKIAKKVFSVLPVGSGIMYDKNQQSKSTKERDSRIKNNLINIGHSIYAITGLLYLMVGINVGVWTPQQYKEHFEKIKLEKVQKEQQRNLVKTQTEQYNQKLFGKNGYAQKDDNLEISSSERFEVCEKAGLEHAIRFPHLSVKDLERAVKSYEADNQK